MERIFVVKYLIAILPPDPIATEILKIKEYFRDKFNSKASLNSPAHITMHMPFEWDKENQLVENFRHFALPTQPLKIDLNGFGCFAPRVIFVSVNENRQLLECQKQLLALCKTKLNLFNADFRDQPFHPHITVGFRDLKKSKFEEAWGEFKLRSFEGSFESSRLSLLKHDGKFWREFV